MKLCTTKFLVLRNKNLIQKYQLEPHHFPETSFHRIVILPKIQCCRIIIFPKRKIAETHLTESSHGRIVELAKNHNGEWHFSESLFSRTSFSRILVQPNVILPNRRFAEY